jgi:hypothetical protein
MKYLEYLKKVCNGVEIHTFETQQQADYFGQCLRDNLKEEEDLDRFELDDIIEIKISVRTVRIKLKSGACATAACS